MFLIDRSPKLFSVSSNLYQHSKKDNDIRVKQKKFYKEKKKKFCQIQALKFNKDNVSLKTNTI